MREKEYVRESMRARPNGGKDYVRESRRARYRANLKKELTKIKKIKVTSKRQSYLKERNMEGGKTTKTRKKKRKSTNEEVKNKRQQMKNENIFFNK
jgi:hypothetical protein